MNEDYLKPGIKRFKQIAEKCNGNITEMAVSFGVLRSTVQNWICEDEEYKEVVEDYRGRLLDKCIKTAGLLANGIPSYEMVDNKAVFAGWKVQPDRNMLRYLISVLGRNDGPSGAKDMARKSEKKEREKGAVNIKEGGEQETPKIENNDDSIM